MAVAFHMTTENIRLQYIYPPSWLDLFGVHSDTMCCDGVLVRRMACESVGRIKLTSMSTFILPPYVTSEDVHFLLTTTCTTKMSSKRKICLHLCFVYIQVKDWFQFEIILAQIYQHTRGVSSLAYMLAYLETDFQVVGTDADNYSLCLITSGDHLDHFYKCY